MGAPTGGGQVMNAHSDSEIPTRLAALLSSVEILSYTRFRLGGGKDIDVNFLPGTAEPKRAGAATDNQLLSALRQALSNAIYFTAYARSWDGEAIEPEAFELKLNPDAAFTASLSAANPTAMRWEAGWKIFRTEANGAVHVHKNDVALQVQAGQYTFVAGGGRPPGIGEMVEILVPRESLTIQPGYYFAFSEMVASDYDSARMGRLYFHVPSYEAAWLIETLATVLNRYHVPFRLKCSTDPAQFDRDDGFVLYVARRFMPVTLRLLKPFVGEFRRRLKESTPLFSKPLLDGLGAADDPGTGESFGQVRSLLVADAILDCWQRERNSATDRYEALKNRFKTAGLSFSLPHLAVGLIDIYFLASESES